MNALPGSFGLCKGGIITVSREAACQFVLTAKMSAH